MQRLLPWALIAIPVLYYFALIVGAATYPGYSHVTNYASELGAAEAPYPWLFNTCTILEGILAIVAAALLPGGLTRLGGSRPWAIVAAIALAMFGVAMVMGGMFPMPDERHGGFGLGLAQPLIPLLVFLASRKVPDSRGLQIFLLAVFVASLVMLAIMFGVGELVTRANVGIWQRLNSLASFPWFAVLGIWLLRRRAA
jgi:heme/copper-type cytochrome/quinol oxidase subunit 4